MTRGAMGDCSPIPLTGGEVRAVLRGAKTQKRIALRPQPSAACAGFQKVFADPPYFEALDAAGRPLLSAFPQGRHGVSPCPPIPPSLRGRLWVRETWAGVNLYGAPGIAYRADGEIRDLMAEADFHCEDGSFDYDDPRIDGIDFDVWVHDLISGAERLGWRHPNRMPRWVSRLTLEVTGVRIERVHEIADEDCVAEGVHDLPTVAARRAFRSSWDGANVKPGYRWADNPWVAVVMFAVHARTE